MCRAQTPLEWLEPSILESSPALRRVVLTGTPLAKDSRALAPLRAAWPAVLLES
jgi:hypothetical protein